MRARGAKGHRHRDPGGRGRRMALCRRRSRRSTTPSGEGAMIVAINKIDKPTPSPSVVRTELLQHEVHGRIVRRRSRSTSRCPPRTDQSRQAAGDDRASSRLPRPSDNPERSGRRHRDSKPSSIAGRGPVATVLVQRGTRASATSRGRRRNGPRPRADSGPGRNHREAGPSVAGPRCRLNGRRKPGDRLGRGRERSPRPPGSRLPRHQKRRKRRRLDFRHARSLEQDGFAASRPRPQGIPADRQGRRAGFARGHSGVAGKTRHRRSRWRILACGCRRHL